MAFSSILVDYLGEGVAADRPASPPISPTALAFYYSTDTSTLELWDGAAWVAASSAGTVTSIVAGAGLAGGTITNSGTISLATIAAGDLLANTTTAAAVPIATSLSAVLDNSAGSTQGDIIFRNGTSWVALPPGTSGNVLSTQGAGADPHWIPVATGGGTVTSISTGAGLSGGPITTTGTIAADWNGGTVTAIGNGLAVGSGTISVNNTLSITGPFTITALPSSDPAVSGEFWVTSSGQVAKSGTAPALPMTFVIAGKPGASQVYNLPMGIAASLNANFAGTVIYDTTLTTSNAIFTVNKISGGVTTAIGTLTVTNASHTSVTLSTQAAVPFAIGDVVQLVAPSSQDATLADIGITLLATKV